MSDRNIERLYERFIYDLGDLLDEAATVYAQGNDAFDAAAWATAAVTMYDRDHPFERMVEALEDAASHDRDAEPDRVEFWQTLTTSLVETVDAIRKHRLAKAKARQAVKEAARRRLNA